MSNIKILFEGSALMAPKSKPENINTLANRVYFAHKLISVIDICNAHAKLSPSSEEFKAEKQNLQLLMQKVEAALGGNDDVFDEAMQAEKLLHEQNVLTQSGELKSDEQLLEQLNASRSAKKAEELKQALAFAEDPGLKNSFLSFMKGYGYADIQSLINKEESLGNPKKLREKLAQDFVLLQAADPTNAIAQKLQPAIAEQTAALNFKYYYTKEDPARNEMISQDFNTNEDSKQKFLKLMGCLLGLGESLKRNDPLIDKSTYDRIRTLSGNDALSDEAIKQAATASYNALCDGLWFYKNKVNPDSHVRKESYIQTNVSQWIKKLKLGKNYLLTLALLSPSEEREYKSADENKQEEIGKKHITVHHKIPKKYHGIFKNPQDQFLINHISNFELIIGGLLHHQKHEQDMTSMVKLSSTKDNAVLCVPVNDFDLKHAKEIAFDVPEPAELANLRPPKITQEPMQQGIFNDNGISR